MNWKTRNLILVFGLLSMFPFILCSQTSEEKIYEEHARQAINDALEGKGHTVTDSLITDYKTATAVAEPVLFKIYGEKTITNEKPYKYSLIDGYWYISGTLKKGWLGGVFEIIINGKDGKIIRVTHEK